MFRLYWSLSQALWSTSSWIALVAIMFSMFIIDERARPLWVDVLIVLTSLVLLLGPVLKRLWQFYQMYVVVIVMSENLKNNIRIGHKRAWSDILLAGHSNNTWNKYFLILDNDLIVAADSYEDLCNYQSAIAKHPTYSQFLGLIVNCGVVDARDPARLQLVDLLE